MNDNAHEVYSILYDILCIYILMIHWISPNVRSSGIYYNTNRFIVVVRAYSELEQGKTNPY
jgi:hypothetical protein